MAHHFIDASVATTIDINDRGFQYGDGFFTTMFADRGQLQLWPRHWHRLKLTASRLGFPPLDEKKILEQCNFACSDTKQLAIRISVSRGPGGRGYAPPAKVIPTVVVSVSDIPSHYESWRSTGIRLKVSEQRLGYQPMLHGLKTLNRLEQVLLKQELERTPDTDELLVLDPNNNVTETTAANVFWRCGSTWYTSALNYAGIAGVVRSELLCHNQVEQGEYPLSNIESADEAFVCNSLMGLVPVCSIGSYTLPTITPYPQQLLTRFSEAY